MTIEQTKMLAAIERNHGRVKRIPDESPIGDELLCQCVTDSRAYKCGNCDLAFTIDPDGECAVWMIVDEEPTTDEGA